MDALSIVVDEVSLEGLDGITVPSLWTRLAHRLPRFPLHLDDCTKGFLWRTLAVNPDLNFYVLPRERDDLQLFDRFRDVDLETGTDPREKFPEEPKDIYPVLVIPDNKDGIRGSCVFFKERKDVTKEVRSKSLAPLMSLEEALEKYGRKLVVVASQTLRFRTLIGSESDPDLKLTNDSYCVLERVGRARWQGELQRDLHAGPFKADARKFHYLRKSLVRHELITMQPYIKRPKSGQQLHTILLLLKRFHVNRRTKYEILMECVSNFLQKLPGQFATVDMLKAYLNLNDVIFKRLFKNIRTAKMTEFCQYPLEDLDPSAGPCTNKNGSKVQVRCVKLIKPYVKKGVTCDEDDEDDDDDDDSPGANRGELPPECRILEKDVISQAYQLILSSGTNGIPQSAIGSRMNVGKLESRMIWRKLERDGVIKGFLVDEGRQRTTRFISHRCVGVSDQLQLFAKEQERKKQLYSSAPQMSNAEPGTSTPPTSNKTTKTCASKKNTKTSRGRKKDAEDWDSRDNGGKKVGKKGGKAKGKSRARRKVSTEKEEVTTKLDIPLIHPAPAECETLVCTGSMTNMTPDSVSIPEPDQSAVEDEQRCNSTQASTLPDCEASNSTDDPTNNIVVVDSVYTQSQRPQETYRLLKRKNLIVEAVRNLKIIDGLFPLRKMISDEEKQNGFSSKCCKKTISRLVHCLSKEGLLKIYSTTVIQDGVTKKVDMIVHPSIQPNDKRVTQLLEQVRFKISSSYSVMRAQREENAPEHLRNLTGPKGEDDEDDIDFKPIPVRGLGKTLGFQPKMHRLRVVHTFLWYLIYGHPLQDQTTAFDSASETATTDLNSSDPDGINPDSQAKQDLKEAGSSRVSNLDETLGDEEELVNGESKTSVSESNMKVYMDEDSWKRFIPPVRLHKNFARGWAMVGDLLLCLPLSIFTQVIQINYKVDGLEEYINDPVKQYHLVRRLPAKMKRQLLYKRKYIHIFHENLQKLAYMGLMQFGPVEKFKDKDQVFIYVKRNATIVDTTNTEPHYWLVTEPPDKPFERRQYTLNTAEDVESYWFDLMCVCLNTPLGVIRTKRNMSEEEDAPSFVHDRSVFVGLAYLLKGSNEVLDDGSIPGDAKGAGGLDSEFFGHLKRNWFWTNHLLSCKTKPSGLEAPQTKTRLKSLLNNALRIALQAGGSTSPHYLTTKRPLMLENVEVAIEPASRNQQVVGGKGQKRKRSKKEVIKVPRKKRKEPKKRTPAHDEADHKALKMMTKQRVYWSVQEDGLMMLCSVASYLLNSKLKRPFIPHCLVRDLLHSEFEISVDKTSVAVGRRSRYILKNPQALLNYRICLAEVYEDKTMMRLLEENKPADTDNPEDCSKSFSEYVRLLRQKISAVMNAQQMIIPDSKQQLFSQFKVSAIDDGNHISCKDTIRCKEDIHTVVLHNLIQSTLAMTNSQMKSSRSFQTFHTYIKYDQELLCQVFIQCRKRRLVNRRRINNAFGPKKNRALPILPMSYQLSQSYFRSFSWRFPHSLCTDSFGFLRSLITNGTGDERPFTSFYHETENRSQEGEEVSERKMVSARKEKQNQGRANCSRVGEPQIQPAVAITDSKKEMDNKPEKLLGSIMTSDEATESISNQQKNPEGSLTSACGDSSLSREQRDSHLVKEPLEVLAASVAACQASEDPPDVSGMMQFSLDSPGGACVVSLTLMTLGLLNVYVSIPKQIVMVDSNLVENDFAKSIAALEDEDDEDEDGEECEGKKKLQVTAHQASHTNYLMMQGYCSPGIVKLRNLSINDNIVVESCFVRLQLRNTPAHHLFSEDISPPLDLTKCGPSVPSILTSYISSASSSPSEEECDRHLIEQRGYTTEDIGACAQLRRSLDEAGEKGLDERDLYESHAHLQEQQSGRTMSLQQYMKDLQEGGQVAKVGSLAVRWVLMHHAEPWLLSVSSKQQSRSYSASEKPPFLTNRHNIPFMRQRTGRERDWDTEEPPSKRLAVDPGKGADAGTDERLSSNATEKANEKEELEQQQQTADESSGGNLVDEEEGAQTQSQEEGKEEVEQQKEETEKKGDKRRRRKPRKSNMNDERQKEACSPSTVSGDDEENLSFISRPWRLVDGKLNRQVCKGMLEAVLYHIMSRPGLTQQSLVEHYKDLLQPVAVLEIVQALIEMGCVKKRTLIKDPKPSLFSRSEHQTRRETSVKFEEADAVFYEPTISCCLRACQLFPNERHWNDSMS
ncbi:general transcription factor 3C polypeptide 1-like [Cololabis saira]|uniref:general transcription factor 3C polypeptide 1-like n=1 Tax=Cololabis saira TaxID=129043 RepID=UPI002AD4DC63|nr:general transcription factor 3C polypeptide 1-like [Cololabis saira]